MGETYVSWCCCCHATNCNLTRYLQHTDFEGRSTDWDRKKNSVLLCDPCLKKAKKIFTELKVYPDPPLHGV